VSLSSTVNLLALLYAGLLGAAAVPDVLTLRIANLFRVAILLVAAVALALHPGANWWQHLLSFGIVLGLGITFFSLGWLGGGDAKMMAGAALAFDLLGLARFVPLVLISGGVLALLAIVLRTVMPGRRVEARKGIPYGVAVAVGGIAALLLFRESTVFAR
jgi:prepilin peptidase CpaA